MKKEGVRPGVRKKRHTAIVCIFAAIGFQYPESASLSLLRIAARTEAKRDEANAPGYFGALVRGQAV